MGTRLSPHSTRGKVLGELAPRNEARWDTREAAAKIAPAWTESRQSLDLARLSVGRGRGADGGGGSLLRDTPARPRVRGQAKWGLQGLAGKAQSAREAPRARGPARPRPARPRPSDRDAPPTPKGYPSPGLTPGGNALPLFSVFGRGRPHLIAATTNDRTRVGSAASRVGAAHPGAEAGHTPGTAGRARLQLGSDFEGRRGAGRAGELTEVHGFVALGTLGGHGQCARSARALRPRPSPRRRGRARPAHSAVRAPIGSVAGAGRRGPAPQVPSPAAGQPPGRGRTCLARCGAAGPARRPSAPRAEWRLPAPRLFPWQRRGRGAGRGGSGSARPPRLGAVLVSGASARKGGPWTRRRTPRRRARPLRRAQALGTTSPGRPPPPPCRAPRSPLLLGFHSNGRAAESESDSWLPGYAAQAGSRPARHPGPTLSVVRKAQRVKGRAPATSKNSAREAAGRRPGKGRPAASGCAKQR